MQEIVFDAKMSWIPQSFTVYKKNFIFILTIPDELLNNKRKSKS